jgi:hypothetical protein
MQAHAKARVWSRRLVQHIWHFFPAYSFFGARAAQIRQLVTRQARRMQTASVCRHRKFPLNVRLERCQLENEKWGQTPFSHVLRLAGDHVAGKACHEDFDELEITTLPF